MKLFELPRDTLFTIVGDRDDAVYWFSHIDGMYSYCKDSQDNVLHFGAMTEVEPHNEEQ